MLAGRPDVLEAMAKTGTRLIIIGKDQVYTDMPEYRNHPNPAYLNERVRGTGGLGVTSFGEENLLNLRRRPLRRREHRASTSSATPSTPPCAASTRAGASGSSQTYQQRDGQGAVEERLRRRRNQAEYWAEICQSLFRLQPRQQLEPRPDRHARATQAVRPRRLRTGPRRRST